MNILRIRRCKPLLYGSGRRTVLTRSGAGRRNIWCGHEALVWASWICCPWGVLLPGEGRAKARRPHCRQDGGRDRGERGNDIWCVSVEQPHGGGRVGTTWAGVMDARRGRRGGLSMERTQHRREELTQPLPPSRATAPFAPLPTQTSPHNTCARQPSRGGPLRPEPRCKGRRAPPLCSRWSSDRLQCPISMVPA